MSQAGILNFDNLPGGLVVETLTGNIGGPVPPTAHNINIIGAGGVTVTGNPGTSTLTITAGGSVIWHDVTTANVNMLPNNGYIMNRAAGVTATLPAAANEGDIIYVVGKLSAGLNVGGWAIAQNAGQTIHQGDVSTTTGAGGSVSAMGQYDTLTIVCTTANTDFVVIGTVSGMFGLQYI